jgi:hypothetical protein
MGVLNDRIESEAKKDIPKYYKENTNKMYNLYRKPDKLVKPVRIGDLSPGKFFFMMYYDESNWMQYSPILFIDSKKFENKIIGYAINFNFIPLEIRSGMLDKMIKDLEDNDQLSSITFENAYKMLLKVGYEYALVEYDLIRVERLYQIDFEILPNFLYSSYPKNKYDPEKLYSIWLKKLETRELRHQEIIQSTVKDFFDITEDISEDYKALEGHIKRLQRNARKFN